MSLQDELKQCAPNFDWSTDKVPLLLKTTDVHKVIDRLTTELAAAKAEIALTEQQVADAMATINTLGFSKDGLIKERDAAHASIVKANAGFEEFERKWYLRGDEIEDLHAQVADVRVDAGRYRYLTGDNWKDLRTDRPKDGDFWVVRYHASPGAIPELQGAGNKMWLDAAIDAATAQEAK